MPSIDINGEAYGARIEHVRVARQRALWAIFHGQCEARRKDERWRVQRKEGGNGIVMCGRQQPCMVIPHLRKTHLDSQNGTNVDRKGSFPGPES